MNFKTPNLRRGQKVLIDGTWEETFFAFVILNGEIYVKTEECESNTIYDSSIVETIEEDGTTKCLNIEILKEK